MLHKFILTICIFFRFRDAQRGVFAILAKNLYVYFGTHYYKLVSPSHMRQYQLRGVLASLHAVTTHLSYFLTQLRTVALLSDINEQIAELRYLAVYVLYLLKRKSETRHQVRSIDYPRNSGNAGCAFTREYCSRYSLLLYFPRRAILVISTRSSKWRIMILLHIYMQNLTRHTFDIREEHY